MNEPPTRAAGPPPASMQGAIDAACDRFESDWRTGQRPRIESALVEVPESVRTTFLWELLALDLAYRRRAGERPTPDDYRGRFPGLEPLIEAAFAPAPETPPEVSTGFPTVSDHNHLDLHASSQAPRGLEIGSSFGRYRIDGLLGGGGMGDVYLAHDTRLDRPVALKVPNLSLADGPEALQRFHREARAAAGLRHPNLCAVHDVGQVGDVPYLTMEYIDGMPLSDMVGRGEPASPRQVARFVLTLARAMAEAHRGGVIHRDLKPANILVRQGGEPVIVDFGLARRLVNDFTITTDGQVLGTPEYMSPEQARGESHGVDGRSDVYSLGVILYRLLTGRRPFEGPGAAILRQIVLEDPPPPSAHRAGLDPRLEAVCLRAMAKRPEDRFASMDELATALRACLEDGGPPPEAAPPDPLGWTIVEAPDAETKEVWAMAIVTAPTSLGTGLSLRSRVTGSMPAVGRAWAARLGWAAAGVAVLALLGVVASFFPRGAPAPAPNPRTVDSPAQTEAGKVALGTLNAVGMRMVLIPAGEFEMGSTDEDPAATPDEKPRHHVRITRPFLLGAFEVTQGEYRALMGENPSAAPGSDRRPVENVTWFDAVAFCNRLSEKEGRPPFYKVSGTDVVISGGDGYRLPTESEWEYARRAGSTSLYSFGDDPARLPDFAWFGEGPGGRPHEVGLKKPNAWGLYDICGNVYEWCWDWYHGGSYTYSTVDDPTGLPACPYNISTRCFRCVRGGCFLYDKKLSLLRSADRFFTMPTTHVRQIGFRVARTPGPPAPTGDGPGTLNAAGMWMVPIPAGEFEMGSTDDDPEVTSDEKPRHHVRITRPFLLGAFEVTQGEYRALMGENPSAAPGSDRRPVENVTWFDAVAFCNRLSEKEGRPPFYKVSGTDVVISGGDGYRLPTESEWEYACRAGSTSLYSFGDDPARLPDFAWFGEGPGGQPHEVGLKKPNAWGLYDICGNVYEWCWDWYYDSSYTHSAVDDPTGRAAPASILAIRCLRGGAFMFDPKKPSLMRAADRYSSIPTNRGRYIGFRVARTPGPPAPDGRRPD